MGEAGSNERLRFDAVSMLASWNGEMSEHLPEPLIYSTWMNFLQKKLISDELGPISKRFNHLNPIFIEKVFRDINGASNWCDIKQSNHQETCRGNDKLQEKYGQIQKENFYLLILNTSLAKAESITAM